MGKIHWYRRFPDAALQGMFELTLEERGAYNTVLDLIYCRDGALPDDDRFLAGTMRCDLRVWRRIKARLVALGKLSVDAGILHNGRADEEVLRALHRVASSREAGLASARSKASKSETNGKHFNGIASTVVVAAVSTGVSTILESEEEKKESEILPSPSSTQRESLDSPAGGKKYVFSAGVIRLNQRNYQQWQKAYPHLSLDAELLALTQWAEKQENWFSAVSGALAKKERQEVRERDRTRVEAELGLKQRQQEEGRDRDWG